nr:type VI secretion system baseplate subunit TssF [Elioraea rosea]
MDDILPFYNRELTYIRKLAAEFATAHPKIAGRLRLAPDAVDDPHVARLLEGFAYLSARVRHKLEDEFPELTDALLGILYPHYLLPFPSCSIVQFAGLPSATTPYRVPAGSALDTEPVSGERCRFRTCYPVTLHPIALDQVRLSGLPLQAPVNRAARGAVASLRIALRCLAADATFAQLGPDTIRFYLRGTPSISLPLHELVLNHTVSVAVADGPNDPSPVVLPADAVREVGFARDEALLPWPARSFAGYRLLTEYFAFPEKFLFFDVTGLDAKALMSGGNRMEIFLYLDRAMPELERTVSADALALGCTPVVNLFPHRCDPLPLDGTATELRVVADARRPRALEVWSVEKVRESRPSGQPRPWLPFYRLAADAGLPGGAERGEAEAPRWHPVRRPAAAPLPGTELFLAFADAGFDPELPADGTLSIDAICFNRDLPASLPFGGGRPRLTAVEGLGGVSSMACLTAPTPTLRPRLAAQGAWKLVSHLALNHLSVTGGEAGAAALREILRLYDLRELAETRAVIEGVVSVTAQDGAARAPGRRPGAFVRGLDVRVDLDPRAFAAGGFLFASVLERFLALHASINSFVRTTAAFAGRPGVIRTWPPRAGELPLL